MAEKTEKIQKDLHATLSGPGQYIPHGSKRHMELLGLRKAEADDTIVYKGHALADPTKYGPQATEAYLREVLRQCVNELQTAPVVPADAPPMWVAPIP